MSATPPRPDERPIDLYPQSCIGVDPPWLVIAKPGNPEIRVDCRRLDKIAAANVHLLLTIEYSDSDNLEVALHIADGSEAAKAISRRLASSTGGIHAPLQSTEPVLRVGNDAVLTSGDCLHVGDLKFRLSDVKEYALAGENLPLRNGGQLQAALCLLVLAAERPMT